MVFRPRVGMQITNGLHYSFLPGVSDLGRSLTPKILADFRYVFYFLSSLKISASLEVDIFLLAFGSLLSRVSLEMVQVIF